MTIARREFLQLLSTTLAAAGLGACREEDLAWVTAPVREGDSPRRDALHAVRTATVRNGYATGVLATSLRGRPIKIEGDPDHALSLGATSAVDQASLLSLYDPDRAAMVMHGAEPSTWGAFAKMLEARGRDGLHVLAAPGSLAEWPGVTWHHWSPLARDNVWAGSRLAWGEALETLVDFSRCRAVLSLDADLFGAMPGALRAARQLAERHARLYAVETSPRTFGAFADHRFALPPTGIVHVALALAHRFGLSDVAVDTPKWLTSVADDLLKHAGVIVVGDEQPPLVHAIAHHINALLAAPIDYVTPALSCTDDSVASLAALCAALDRGDVRTLLIAGCNPVYDAPADFKFAVRMKKAGATIALADRCDETASHCAWLVPLAHAFETTGTVKDATGTALTQQPLVSAPQRKSLSEVLSLIGSAPPHTASASAKRVLQKLPAFAAPPATRWELAFRADPTIGDGSDANNAWLQELSKPLLGVTWENVIAIHSADATRERIATGDVVRVALNGAAVEGPALVHDMQASGALTLYLGGGRTHAGRVGNGIGYNAYALRSSQAMWSANGVTLTRTGKRTVLAMPQQHHQMEGRPLALTRAELARAEPASQPSLYETPQYTGHAWAMSIDLDRCIGCRACTAACQAENNIPVVGKDQVIAGRAMEWIRVDEYAGVFQPVPCMHCENAPCEVVCPTGATTHDHEGLNQMVYNRCVGTRYCSNNCPYKVRRFNFFHYSAEQTWQMRNPEVSVRGRGVMEKCTYCIQRIQRARIAADHEKREMGDVVTACAQACPTQAIVFGDANSASAVAEKRRDPRHYVLLGELGTRPRTTYLCKVPNPNPELA